MGNSLSPAAVGPCPHPEQLSGGTGGLYERVTYLLTAKGVPETEQNETHRKNVGTST